MQSQALLGRLTLFPNALLCDIARFNWLPIEYIDDSWLAPWLSPAQVEAIRLNRGASRTLNQFLLDEGPGMEALPLSAFNDPVLQMMVLPPEVLRRVVVYAGLALNCGEIKKVISGQKQKELKSTFGEAAYQFALQRAEFMAAPLGILDGVAAHSQSDIPKLVNVSGMIMLGAVTANLAVNARNRIRYYFSRDSADLLDTGHQGECSTISPTHEANSDTATIAAALFFKIVKELHPQWQTVSV